MHVVGRKGKGQQKKEGSMDECSIEDGRIYMSRVEELINIFVRPDHHFF